MGVFRSRCRSKHTGPDKECRSCELPAEDDYSQNGIWFFENERDNVEDDELATLREIGKGFLTADDAAMARALAEGIIQEVAYDEEEKDQPVDQRASRDGGRYAKGRAPGPGCS